jgi:transposase
MPIVGGLDIHRKQITFDWVDTDTGELQRGRIAPADRAHLADWLTRRVAGRAEVHLALEGCTGWRYVAEELARAGVIPHLAEPADTAALRGRKRHPKTDRADSQHLRQLLIDGRLPQCWIPPAHILEDRALLETYHDLRVAHTAWVQRIHAVLFHQGARRRCGEGGLRSAQGQAELAAITATELSPAGQRQVATALAMLTALDEQLDQLRRQLVTAANQLTGARVLTAAVWGGADHRVGVDLLAGRGRPVLLRPQGGAVRRTRCHRALLRRQTITGAPVPARPGGAALVFV